MSENSDVIIIGAGIIGAAVARELSRCKLNIILLDKESDVCRGASRANNGMIHSGNDPEPGTLKAKHNVIGNKLYSRWAQDLKFPFKRIGVWITGRSEEDIAALERLMERGEKNGVYDIELITDIKRLRKEEPNLDIIAAVNAPATGVVMPHLVVIALVENAVLNGVKLLLNKKVTGINIENDSIKGVRTNHGFIETTVVVNAAGVYSDEIAGMAGLNDFKIKPRKGECLVLDKHSCPVKRLIYPAPAKISKGIGILPTIDGNLLLGPTAEDIDNKQDCSTTFDGRERILKETLQTCPVIDKSRIIAAFAGIRAVSSTNDFIIGHTAVNGFYNAAGIQSPGLSSAPSIAREISDMVAKYMNAEPDPFFNPENKPKVRFTALSPSKKQKLLKKDKRYGHIVCRCENITEYEVVEAIHSPVGAKSLDALKSRLRTGMGRCQGGFCTPKIMKILQRELQIKMEQITLKEPGSEILDSKLRKGWRQ